MSRFELVALTPPGLEDPGVAIAASRAGGVGVLDLEWSRDHSRALTALHKLVRLASANYGVRLAGSARDFNSALFAALPQQSVVIVLTRAEQSELRRQIERLVGTPHRVYVECVSVEEVHQAEALGAYGVVAKGHEAGGWAGDESTFILLQHIAAAGVRVPVWAHGGIGLHTAAACYAAGAAGVVLDAQLCLTRESGVPEDAHEWLARLDGSESVLLDNGRGAGLRVSGRRGPGGAQTIQRVADAAREAFDDAQRRQAISAYVGWDRATALVPLGQDAAFAASLAGRFRTVGGVLEAFRNAIASHLTIAQREQSLGPDSPLASSHGTRYPIVQGPMTRVSDRAEFARTVAEGGALPFLALALMRSAEVDRLLDETRRAVGDRPWGVGILGFVPQELREEQLAVIQRHRPSFALIAGGRPDQALVLEHAGIPTYLHVPSPELLKVFLGQGARRFVFEGRECGGHVGPRSSFVLWNDMVDTLLEHVPTTDWAGCHVLFAGGIHDALSAAMVAATAAPLAERGARIGVLLGTAYLFTRECVETGAISAVFQDQALDCRRTVLLETGPGHATRCAASPYVEVFEQEKRRLLSEGESADTVRGALEELNLGRLRLASKALRRAGSGDSLGRSNGVAHAVPHLESVRPEVQLSDGMFMIGQVAALRSATCSISELHADVSIGGSERLATMVSPDWQTHDAAPAEQPSDIAIIGMACMLPGAPNLQTYWQNILNRVDAISEVPPDRWDWQRYFDPDPGARDKVYSRWGGFLEDVVFDPLRYGMPPNSLPSIEPLQLLTLEVARAALEDAGYLERPFARERTSVILGAGGGVADLGNRYAVRSALPTYLDSVPSDVLDRLPEWTEESFPGILLNVAAGRVANRLDLRGVNYTVDAACASSLAAVYLGTRELESASSDMVLVGGIDTVQNPFGYLCFSKTHALSPRGRCRTFDETADGITISEGLAIVVLKRLADAERDGDRIYAVIKSVAGSSDGRDKSLTAPRPEGQELALRRAYAKAHCSPASIGLVEAHGTGTVAGDQAEIESLKRVYQTAGAAPESCAIGSVKSMIGHTKCAAGVAGLIKVSLALHNRVLPATLHVDRPNPKAGFFGSPFYVNTESRPWLGDGDGEPRRAAVSAFGFGGTNFHAVLEEYTADATDARGRAVTQEWPAELLLCSASSRGELLERVDALARSLAQGARPRLRDLAYTLSLAARGNEGYVVALVVTSREDAATKLARVRDVLASGHATDGGDIADPTGVYFTTRPLGRTGKIAFLFPGQGAQSPNMLRDLALHFADVRERFETADRVLAERLPEKLSSYIFPVPAFTSAERAEQERALTQTAVAQPALGAADLAVFELLRGIGIRPDMVGGHSYGEYVALCAAGVFGEADLYKLSEARGRFIAEGITSDSGTMAAARAPVDAVQDILSGIDGVWIANVNAPRQTVISGTHAGVDCATARLRDAGIVTTPLNVACAFHSPLVASARTRLASLIAEVKFNPPRVAVFSNVTAAPYPSDVRTMQSMLADHLVEPVRFAAQVEAMHDAGARIFVEAGPRGALGSLVEQILAGRDHVAIPTAVGNDNGHAQLLHALAQLATHGVDLNLTPLFRGRGARRYNLTTLVEDTAETSPAPGTWLVNGSRARPARETTQPLARPVTPVPNGVGVNGQNTQPPVVAPPPAPVTQGEGEDETGRIVLRFQHMMSQFLETQQRVMLAYLQGSSEALPAMQPLAPIAAQAPVAPAVTPAPPEQALLPVSGANRGLLDTLLEIVSTRTGYEPKDLDVDINIESELGIDSIKRTEILGALRLRCPPQSQADMQSSLEQLVNLKTLRGIADAAQAIIGGNLVNGALQSESREALVALPKDTDAAQSSAAEPAPPRFVLRPVDRPSDESSVRALPTDGVFVITEDDRGVGFALAEAIRARGARAVRVRPGLASDASDGELYMADLTDPREVAALVQRIRQNHGPIGGVVHLVALDQHAPLSSLSLVDWKTRLATDVKSLFYLARAAEPDITSTPDGVLIAATGMGGAFGVDATGDRPALPSHGGVAALVKSLSMEWARQRVAVIDLDGSLPPAELAACIITEITAGDRNVEVGFQRRRRFVLEAQPAPLDAQPRSFALDSSSVVLIVGGGRGITSEIAREVAQRYRSTLILVGRTMLAEPAQAAALDAFANPRELKAALIQKLTPRGQAPNLAEVESEYARVYRDREIRATLDDIRGAGASAHYFQVDVCDERAVRKLVSDIHRRFGRLDAVVHGAGIIEDHLIKDKTPDSFDRVFDTKAVGAFVLSQALESERLEFFALFSSVAGCFGNRGQVDYAAANGVLNKLAVELDARWPGRVVAINWGPWASRGMVSAEVKRQFASRGLSPLTATAGRNAWVLELERGRKGDAEVVIGDGPWREPRGRLVLPLLEKQQVVTGSDDLEVTRLLDASQDLYLLDHQLDGRPVLPAAVAIELMAELAQQARPDWHVAEIQSLRVLKGIVVAEEPRHIRVCARPVQSSSRDEMRLALSIDVPGVSGISYRADVLLHEQLPEPPTSIVTLDDLEPLSVSVPQAYSEWLFQGPRFQGIQSVLGINTAGIAGELRPSAPARLLSSVSAEQWLVDPVVIDSAFQLAIVWARSHLDMTPLPAAIRRFRRFAAFAGPQVRCDVHVRASAGGHVLEATYVFRSTNGDVVALLEDMELACSAGMNRLARHRPAVAAR